MAKRRKSSRRKSAATGQCIIAVSPYGQPIHDIADLPELPLPKKVVVSGDVLRVDGWQIRFWPIWMSLLTWLETQAGRWCKEDPRPENKAQVCGVIDALETMVKKKECGGGPKQGEFDF